MPELTRKEVEKRMQEAAARARKSIAKKEVLQFRLESEKILKLYEIAAEQKIDLSKLLRQVVSDFIDKQGAAFPLAASSISSLPIVSEAAGDPLYHALMVIYDQICTARTFRELPSSNSKVKTLKKTVKPKIRASGRRKGTH